LFDEDSPQKNRSHIVLSKLHLQSGTQMVQQSSKSSSLNSSFVMKQLEEGREMDILSGSGNKNQLF